MSGTDDAARAERLAAALRENLKRRKAQMRGRQAESVEPATPAPDAGAAGRDPSDAVASVHPPKPGRAD
ncbi:MAG: hypothetical protein K0S00_1590 [Xanthobacteraceae bacterium]|jgi:hypothetical protein|nr:hypothetical protein [Xanthobacteraceae bacterium]